MPTVALPGRGDVACQWSGSGPEIVVLINGSVFNYHQWDRQALPVLNRGLGRRCRFLQYDYIGVGGSSAKTTPFSMLDLAEELRELLDALSLGQVHLLGISKGSAVGQAFMIRHADRVKSFCGLGNPNINSPDLAQVFENFKARIKALEDLKELWPQRVNPENYLRIFNHVYVPIMFFKTYSELSLVERLKAFIVRRMVYPAMEGTFVQTMADIFRYFVEGVSQDRPTFLEKLPKVSGIPILLLNGTA
ncbi:MAG: alpha/beta hydrolase, partial [Deltaproteobacteria bacterium]|nr:alpha/beta hydrolase [Deltaproteobacteria bacterium]